MYFNFLGTVYIFTDPVTFHDVFLHVCTSCLVVMVMFAESEYNESEGAGSMRIEVQLSRILQQMITIQIVTTPITAEGFVLIHCYNNLVMNVLTGNGIDFDSTIRNVTFMAGNDSSFVSIPIIDNNAVENIENFSLSIQISPALADIGVMLGTPSMATGFIVDDDGKSLSYGRYLFLRIYFCSD